MISTAADNAGKQKTSHNMATHPGLAEQSDGNMMPGGFLLLLLLLLLASSLSIAIDLLKDLFTRTNGERSGLVTCFEVMNEDPLPPITATQCRDPDAAQQIRNAAATAGRERRLMKAKRQRAVLAAAVKDYRMAQEVLALTAP